MRYLKVVMAQTLSQFAIILNITSYKKLSIFNAGSNNYDQLLFYKTTLYMISEF